MLIMNLLTNSMRYPLFTLLVEDYNDVGQPVAYALISYEDTSM